ncbi:NAD(P)H-dependent flavin oxidoreductase [Ensifer aridi]|uniref:NAD(P)H-dependent flavin oxidoreductase n=1 Tax=Ensifer aridi TaxID=1708715 RepID=UPI0003F8E7D4|nr:nitronate monooxygenase [Ensifer aridi]
MSSHSIENLLKLAGITVPIVQAPMAGVSSPAMAAAISQAGGLGSLGVGALTPEAARAAIRAFRERSSGSLNINVFAHKPASGHAERERRWIERARPVFSRYEAKPPSTLKEIYRSFIEDDEMLAVLIDERPRVVSFHFGIPSPARVAPLREAGITLFASVTSLAEGREAEAAGIQAVVAQGYEAGGHRGIFDPDADDSRLGTVALTRILVKTLRIPVVAAGGIMDGAGIAAVLRLGAGAAQLGTAFVGCPESLADEGYRAALFSDAASHTMMTRAISGRPARCLANRFTAWAAGTADEDVPEYPIAYDLGNALHAAAKAKGETGYGAQWAGQGAPLARALPAGELMGKLIEELNAA